MTFLRVTFLMADEAICTSFAFAGGGSGKVLIVGMYLPGCGFLSIFALWAQRQMHMCGIGMTLWRGFPGRKCAACLVTAFSCISFPCFCRPCSRSSGPPILTWLTSQLLWLVAITDAHAAGLHQPPLCALLPTSEDFTWGYGAGGWTATV